MPVDYKRYPNDWKAISARIRARSGGRCECESHCGLHTTTGRCREINGQPAKWAKGKVVLTVAHLGVAKPDGAKGDKHDKTDCRDENLKAMCQRCHLRFDLDEHMANAAKTRKAKALKRQPELAL